MTHRKSWLTMARAFFTPLKERTNKQRQLTTWIFGRSGICNGLSFWEACLFVRAFCPYDKAVKPDWAASHWWPRSDVGDKRRALFCLVIAEMGEETYNEMINYNVKKEN